MRRIVPFVIIGLVVAAAWPGLAHASATGSGGLPWETPLQTLETSIQGPVAYGVSLLGIVASGGMLVFGGEIAEFTRRVMYLVLVVAVIAGAASVMSTLFSSSSMVV